MLRYVVCLIVPIAVAACAPPPEVGNETGEQPAPDEFAQPDNGSGDEAISAPKECDAQAGASFIGQKYSADLDDGLRAATGAKGLRVTHMNSPVTMDYNPTRLTVAYDDDGLIVSMSCG